MQLFLFGAIIMAFFMVIAKRMSSLIAGFSLQSFFLFLLTLTMAVGERSSELFVIAGFILALKVVLIPVFLRHIVRKIGIAENLGLFINPLLSLAVALLLTHLAYLFAHHVLPLGGGARVSALALSLAVMLIGLFLMVSRLKAVTQIVGLLTMENGSFLAAVALCGTMPFLLDIMIFFDILMCVIILGIFVYRIQRVFTHIDIDKLTVLKG